ncbi:uridine kinase [Actinoplanes sp. TFC3]|uniref:uridine kinase family protein n=1 Tax=Actinoplanes sp. TFC3 TaxID=1710355 RepID=UPI001F46A487|nr:hypothetical protein [Actinoplanes sp. TFC3]
MHTDDLLNGWEDQFTFWTRLEEQVLGPLRQGCSGRYQRYLWHRGAFGGVPVFVDAAPVVLLEGSSSARSVIRPELSYSIFLDAPADVGWRRVVARDGGDDVAFQQYLERWHAAEQEHFAADQTAAFVDLLVDGAARSFGEEYEEL